MNMLVELKPYYKEIFGMRIPVGRKEGRPLGVNDCVVLNKGIDDASSDEFVTFARVREKPNSVELIHQWGLDAVILCTLEFCQVNSDPRTRGHLRWVD